MGRAAFGAFSLHQKNAEGGRVSNDHPRSFSLVDSFPSLVDPSWFSVTFIDASNDAGGRILGFGEVFSSSRPHSLQCRHKPHPVTRFQRVAFVENSIDSLQTADFSVLNAARRQDRLRISLWQVNSRFLIRCEFAR